MSLKRTNMNKAIWTLVLIVSSGYLQAQVVTNFNFSAGSQQVSGWINVAGDPSVAVRTATDPVSGISISSVATANWSPYNGSASYDGGGTAGGSFFPAAVMMNEWFQYSSYLAVYNSQAPQLLIGGLSTDSVYTLKMTGSYAAGNFDLNPIRYTVSGATIYGYVDVNGNSNTTNGAVFTNVVPDASGNIRVYVNTLSTTNIAGICGIQIVSGHTTALVPVVSITNPGNNDVIAEDGNITISATATETGGSISRVAFYANSILIGIDSVAPYNLVWYSPNEGKYTITATATDGRGNNTSSSINISIESLTSFWSMTGNIGMNADSNFVGNVDSVRLAFRTKNMERMSISPLGNVGIGTIAPSAQLHTTGTVRLAGLTSDSTKNRVLVSDTSGNLFYRNMTSLSGRWQYANGTAYDSTDNIGIGTNNTQGYKLAVNGAGIFTKVRIKPQANWPDFVFKKEYQLPELADLEQYITQHQHLPGILSETEQLQEGVDVGSHQAALLQKIEELTLYVIKQNKALADQHKAMDEQNRKFEQQQLQLQLQQQEIDALKKLIQPKN
jgi:Big-like domain-containing protein